MGQDRAELVAWVAGNVVPHESAVRDKLRSVGVPEHEIDDIMQDAYLRISHLDSVAHIRNGRGYLFTVARSMMLLRVRRERIVRIDSLSDYDVLTLADDDPGPERHTAARIDLERVHQMIASLPSPCREIFEMRRVQGVPQREISARMGVSEHVVEKLSARGLRLILKAIAGGNREAASPAKQRIERKLRDVGFE